MYEGDCIYYNGVQHADCRAGVPYKTLQRPIPCLTIPGVAQIDPNGCALFRAITKEEHDKLQAEQDEAFKKTLKALAEGTCHICGAEAEPSTCVGRCVYNACGHRRGPV